MRSPIVGFAPDLDPTTPGILTDCDNVIPTTQGFASGNSRVTAGFPALAAACTGAYVANLLNGTKRLFAGTSTNIYEGSSLVWTDRSRVGNYTGSNRWRWTMFGDVTLATNRSQPLQQALASASFADIAGAPSAAVMCNASGFVMLGDFNNGTDTPDGWFCSGIYDQTIWTPSIATQCANGRLVDSPGRITAMQALGPDVVAYKNTSMYLGTYQGGNIIWSWQRIPGDIGVASQESVVVVQTQHFFIGTNDFYVYDGTVPRSIGAPLREWFFANMNRTYQANIIGVADPARDLVYWYYPSTASTSGALDSFIVYNYRKDQWGKGAAAIEAAVQYSSGAVTYDGLGTLYSTYDNLPNIAYDSPFWLADTTVPAIIDTSHILQTLTGDPGRSSWVTGDWGDDTDYTYVQRVTPRFRYTPTAATCTNFYKNQLSFALTTDQTASISKYRFDFRRSARYHRLRFDFTDKVALDGWDFNIKAASKE